MIKVQEKYGCLTVLDEGEEYKNSDKYNSLAKEHDALIDEITLYQAATTNDEKRKIIELFPSSSFMYKLKENPANLDRIYKDFLKSYICSNIHQIQKIESILSTHYKCKCKCGKIHYYDAKTIESCPRYCFYPIPISTRCTYSGRAQNATYRKQQKYSGLECIILRDKTECMPSDEFCDNYNSYKIKQLEKKEEQLKNDISKIPRVYADNYDVDYSGKQYETLCIEKCIDEKHESEPKFSYNQRHNKCWHNITVYKQYKCKCDLCGKEINVNCDQFGIYPPTDYGYHAYHGYWSAVSCDCHVITSFQWIVCKLLFEADVKYKAEYSFQGLYGVGGINLLRFDFAVFNDSGNISYLIECQGEQHYHPVEEFGGSKAYDIQVKNDEIKRQFADEKCIPLICISYKTKKYEEIKKILESENII